MITTNSSWNRSQGSTEYVFDHISLREVRLRLNTHPVVFFFFCFRSLRSYNTDTDELDYYYDGGRVGVRRRRVWERREKEIDEFRSSDAEEEYKKEEEE